MDPNFIALSNLNIDTPYAVCVILFNKYNRTLVNSDFSGFIPQ